MKKTAISHTCTGKGGKIQIGQERISLPIRYYDFVNSLKTHPVVRSDMNTWEFATVYIHSI